MTTFDQIGGDVLHLDDVCLPDLFTTGLKVSQVDRWHFRLVWWVTKETNHGEVRVPVASVVVSRSLMISSAQAMARSHALGAVDTVGPTIGSS